MIILQARARLKRPLIILGVIVVIFIVSLLISENVRRIQLEALEDRMNRGSWNNTARIQFEEQLTGSLHPIQNDRESHPCDTINLAMICGGSNSTRDLYVMLKSILFYRTNSVISLHLFTDGISRRVLNELFRTWQVPNLELTYYNISNYEQDVSWIPTKHYSNRYGFMKLISLSVLAQKQELKEVIVLDTDIIILGDIKLVWEEFRVMRNSSTTRSIGLVENQSDWYLDTPRRPFSGRVVWPALGRGFNTGVVLVDLVRLRKIDWTQIWRQITELELVSHLTTALADQDIFNAVIKSHEELVHRLPCALNIQLNDNVDLEKICPIANRPIMIVHWNTIHKLESKNPWAAFFKSWFLTFRNWDAKLLERNNFCHGHDLVNFRGHQSILNANNLSICQDLSPKPSDRLRTFLFYMGLDIWETDESDVTFVTHLTIDRLRILDELAAHWRGPISVAIYLSESETDLFHLSMQESDNLAARSNIGYHLVYRDHGFNYPINRLRNIALENALTPYVFLCDIDFLPSYNLYNYLKSTIREFYEDALPGRDGRKVALAKKALVVPAFENLQYKFDFPSNKADLETQLNLGSVSMFRDQIWSKGHRATDYNRWGKSIKPYKVHWEPDYEPFIVTVTNVPRFDERFVGFGWNKVEHMMELVASGYEIFVLPEAFVIHQLHPASYDIIKHRKSRRYRSCILHLKTKFLQELKLKYPDFPP